MESARLRAVLNYYGRRTVAEMQAILRSADKEASGRLIRSIKHEVIEAGEALFLLIEAAPHAKYVDEGRRPGTMPPVDSIREWTKMKGIPEKAAWPIARSIFKFGIKPTPFWNVTLDNLDERMKDDIAKAMRLDFEADIKKAIRDANNS